MNKITMIKTAASAAVFFPLFTFAHSDQQQRVGPTIWKGIFFGSILLLCCLILFRLIDLLHKDGLIKTMLFGLVGCTTIGVIVYCGYHYFFH